MDRKMCPNKDDHVEHYWRYSDEDKDKPHYCPGLLTINVDILERQIDAG